MQRESLIESLGTLLDTSDRRRRATDGLLRTLKGANNALIKAHRSLDDYAEQRVYLDEAQVAQAQQAMEALGFKDAVYDRLYNTLRRESKDLSNQVKALRDVITALQGDIVDLIKLDRAYHILQQSPLQDEDFQALVPDLEGEIEQAQTRLGTEFGAALRDALAELGIEIGGRPPRFEVGRFEILADFVGRSAKISYGKTELVPRVKLSLETVIKAYQKEVQSVENRNEVGERWMQQLHTAWQNAQLKQSRKSQRVNIVDCYYELVLLRQKRNFGSSPSKKSFVDYNRAQFAYDFFEFTHNQNLSYNGLTLSAHTATKSQAESPSRSMWIVEGDSPYTGRYISDIEFV